MGEFVPVTLLYEHFTIHNEETCHVILFCFFGVFVLILIFQQRKEIKFKPKGLE